MATLSQHCITHKKSKKAQTELIGLGFIWRREQDLCFCVAKSKWSVAERYIISDCPVRGAKASAAIGNNSKGMHLLHPFTVVTASKLAHGGENRI